MKQLAFPCKGRGGYRPGSGRKRGKKVMHHGRGEIRRPIPLHAIWRTRRDVRSLRGKKLWQQIREAFRRCHEKRGFRLIHFSVQGNHLHLIVEADNAAGLSRGMQGLGVSMAKRINRVSDRHGPAFDDRFFARPLGTPREVANAVDYVLHNEARHLARQGLEPLLPVDPFTSEALGPDDGDLVAHARTWLLCVGVARARGTG
jgi:putative transposase